MAHSEKQQPGSNHSQDSHNRHKSQALSREVEDLNNGLRVDFDQKLSELADLLARFKALVVAPSKDAANDDDDKLTPPLRLVQDTPEQNATGHSASVTPIFNNSSVVPDDSAAEDHVANSPQIAESELNDKSINDESTDTGDLSATVPDDVTLNTPVGNSATTNSYTSKPARFESGLYKLNCQLYRFRLELDQELEFREELLHEHFHQESDLSQVLQKLSDKSGEKHPDN